MRKPIFFFYLLVVPFISMVFGQVDSTSTNTIFQKLVKEQFTSVIIEADFDSLVDNKNLAVEQVAKLTFRTVAAKELKLTLKLKARGLFRRRYCDIPPLRLNFDKEQLTKDSLHADFDKLKLVTHCISSQGDQALMKEYWAYKLYNELTPNSFQVHLLKISYVDKHSKKFIQERMGFIIESNKELAARLGGELVDSFGLTAAGVKKESYQNCMMFNYMIGNLDWELRKQRNIKLIQPTRSAPIIIVPYDFDMSALVWPSYARLNPNYKQQRFSDRYCVGVFETLEDVKETIQAFQKVKDFNLSCLEKCPFLTKESKEGMEQYLNSFYKVTKKEKRLKKIFL